MLCKEIGRLEMQPFCLASVKRTPGASPVHGDGGQGFEKPDVPFRSSVFPPMCLPQIRAGGAARCRCVISQRSSLFATHGFSMRLSLFLQRHIGRVVPKGHE